MCEQEGAALRKQVQLLQMQLLATQRAMRALMARFPDPAHAALTVWQHLEHLRDQSLVRPVSEADIQAIEAARKRILPQGYKPPMGG